ncbi:hypothetical protein ABZ517_38210 [Streptomyces scabiei]|uniref:hypothetical protein n=1 Tax=Streptomyces scabiei TaxID=1930 RepID=UPI0033DB6690
MTYTVVTAIATLLAVIAALEHLPGALTRLVTACMPLVRAWRELRRAVAQNLDDPDDGLLEVDVTRTAQARDTGFPPADDHPTHAESRSRPIYPSAAQDPEPRPDSPEFRVH